jgi:hypothetical protein
VFIASIPASSNERTGYFFLFGLIPALGFYLIGYILRGMLALSGKLCGIIAPHFLSWQASFTERLLIWASASALDLLDRCSAALAHCRLATGQRMQILSRWARKERCALKRQYRCACRAIIEFSCLLIRNAARFVITLRQPVDRSTKQASCLSFDDMTLLMSRNMQRKQPPQARRPQAGRPQPVPLDSKFGTNELFTPDRTFKSKGAANCGGTNTTVSLNENIIRAGVNFKFGGGWWERGCSARFCETRPGRYVPRRTTSGIRKERING